MNELPTGTVTFLFTDLAVSTRLWEQEPDAMRAALARHDFIVREAVAKHDGEVVKGTGDGAHACSQPRVGRLVRRSTRRSHWGPRIGG